MFLAPVTVAVAAAVNATAIALPLAVVAVDWNPVLLAIAALIVVVSNLLPTIVTLMAHSSQASKMDSNSHKLDTIQVQTNGASQEAQRLIADLQKQIAVLQARLDAQPHWMASSLTRPPDSPAPGDVGRHTP